MSRCHGDLSDPGYRPLLQWNARQQPEGGDVQDPLQVTDIGPPRHELVVLVHGFNNNRCDAQQAYLALRSGQRPLGDAAAPQRLEDLLADAFWPGDAAWPGLLDALDFLVYPAAIGKALQTAEVLAAHLQGLHGLGAVHFIGHSMGCRVILEVLQRLQQAGSALPARRVLLMAAAVPTHKLLPGGALRPGLDWLLARGGELRVLYSPGDRVLSAAFPPGQTLGGRDEGVFPEAVGRFGNVPGLAGVDVQGVAGGDHGDYWGIPADVTHPEAAAQVVQHIASFLGARPPPPASPAARELQARSGPLARSLDAAWLPG